MIAKDHCREMKALVLTLGLIGCVGDGPDAGFRMTWRIESAEGLEVSCRDASGRYVNIEVVDSRGGRHAYRTACEAHAFDTPGWDIAVGRGRVSATLTSDEGEVLSTVQELTFDFVSGQLDNEITNQRFVIEGPPPKGPLVTWYWRLIDDAGDFVDCDRAGATFLRFALEDAGGTAHPLATVPCRAASGHRAHLQDGVTEGDAVFTIELLNRNRATVTSHPFEVSIPEGEGDLEISVTTVEVTPFVLGGDAGITWEWRYDAQYLTEARCADLGVDYARLWIRKEAFGGWWSDPRALSVVCGAVDHGGDYPIWGDEIYSGFFNDSLLEAGEHGLLMGFYHAAGAGEVADVLVFHDLAGDAADGTVELMANDETERGTNLLVSSFLPGDIPERGALKVGLQWAATEDELLTTCTAAGISEMGFFLQSGGVPVAELQYGAGYPCRDWIELPAVPILDEPYELIIYGISLDNEISYYARCGGLIPEAGVTLDDADGAVCRIFS